MPSRIDDRTRRIAPRRLALIAALLLPVILVTSLMQPRASAANTVDIVVWNCPPTTPITTPSDQLPGLCATPAEQVTLSLVTRNLALPKSTGSGQSASWTGLPGAFVLSIVTPANEPAIVLCTQNGQEARFEAPDGIVNGELIAPVAMTCQWYRLVNEASTAANPTPTTDPAVTSSTPATPVGVTTTRVDIGGRALSLSCAGAGAPTVLLEAGGPGGTSARWDAVFTDLTALTRTCRYDRAGLGGSDKPPEGIRTIQDSANDLRALINAGSLGCPCVLVGESWGGSILRLFAGENGSDVAGLVYVDTMPPGFIDQLSALIDSLQDGYSYLTGPTDLESMDQLASFRAADAAKPPPAVPAVVLTHGLSLGFPVNFPVDQLEAAWRAGQRRYASAIGARLFIATRSGNSILRDEPGLVTASVKSVIEAVRDPAAIQTMLTITRVNASEQPLTSACFQVHTDAGNGTRGDYRDGACDDTNGDAISDGVTTFNPLPPGKYVIEEYQPPYGIPAAPDTPVTLSGFATTVTITDASTGTPPANALTPTTTATVTVTTTP